MIFTNACDKLIGGDAGRSDGVQTRSNRVLATLGLAPASLVGLVLKCSAASWA